MCRVAVRSSLRCARYLIMEYVDGGELFHYIDERKGLPEDESVLIFRQIVSGLLYCHRMSICHRDLKPENILLSRVDLTVKLIDFGMAALQPEGKRLTTPCGSPHYAAPEVISTRPYDGTQADVWSCGVILFVMLTGTTPFNHSPDGDVRLLFRDIARAKYWMPSNISHMAKDLISRIFVADPKRRITMDGVWEHPFLHKYDKKLGYEGENGTKEAAIGLSRSLEDCTVKRIQDIDREILRNMRTLWHSEPEHSLIRKLVSNDINQEKLFYAALVKHKEENLENYVGNGGDMEYSASDYHHSQPVRPADAPPLPTMPRSQSQYSIMNDEHLLRPSHSFVEPPPSVSSYDPYRASKGALVNARDQYVNVIVHRNSSAGTRQTTNSRSSRNPHTLRVEIMKQHTRRNANISTSSLARSGRSRSSVQGSSVSRSSLTSSAWASSPPVIATMRPSDHHKRGVSFGHGRRTSTTRGGSASLESTKSIAPNTPRLAEGARDKRIASSKKHAVDSSPAVQAARALHSRKERMQVSSTSRIKAKKPETGSQHMRSEIRKHSAELEKACEEAFNRSPTPSQTTGPTTVTGKQTGLNTPPSAGTGSPAAVPRSQSKTVGRPLPQVPADTPTTYLTKTLEETREKLAAYKLSGEDSKFDEVMRMLEDIMPASRLLPGQETRSFTAPEAKTSDHLGFLPMITEEGDQRGTNDPSSRNWQRSVTAPVQRTKDGGDSTIRIVSPDPSIVAPLNVRKRGDGSFARDDNQNVDDTRTFGERLAATRITEPLIGLSAVAEDVTTPSAEYAGVRKKKSVWFGLVKKDAESPVESRKSPELGLLRKQAPCISVPVKDKTPSAQSPRNEHVVKKKNGLSKWLGKLSDKGDTERFAAGEARSHARTEQPGRARPSNPAFNNRSLDSLFSSASPSPSSNDDPPSSGMERSWFARFFHVKPAVQSLCFTIPRGRARQELVLLLREWQKHGIQDLAYSRETNTIVARVDRQNSLDIKPVTFRIHLFVVLEHGRRAGLSIARFQQVKGAASAFRHVLEVVDGVMRGRGWLVQDEEKRKAMCEVVGG